MVLKMLSNLTKLGTSYEDTEVKVGTAKVTQKGRVRSLWVYQERLFVSCRNQVSFLFNKVKIDLIVIDLKQIRRDLQEVYNKGVRSLAIVFVHSYTYPEHEKQVAEVAKEIGFKHVSASSQLLSMIKMVPRGVSATADAYLTPVLSDYINGFFQGFDDAIGDGSGQDGGCRVEFMGSDGGLLDLRNFSGLKAILSGPAGGKRCF